VGTNIGGGFAVNTSTSAISGLIIDATKSQMLTITQTGDNVSLY
jgi:hypothetical protein